MVLPCWYPPSRPGHLPPNSHYPDFCPYPFMLPVAELLGVGTLSNLSDPPPPFFASEIVVLVL